MFAADFAISRTALMRRSLSILFATVFLVALGAPLAYARGDVSSVYAGSVAAAAAAGNTWVRQTSGTAYILRDVDFVNRSTGWAVGDGGTILKTIDGGANWVSQNSGTSVYLSAVSFADRNSGWVVRGLEVTYKVGGMKNGGASWAELSSSTTSQLHDIFFIDANTGWAAGNDRILKTIDGGATWKTYMTADTYWLKAIHFIDAKNGWAAGSWGTILKTTDGGLTWGVAGYSGGNPESICFVDANTGWVAGVRGIYKTTNGGATWVNQSTSANPVLYDVSFVDANTGWVTGRDVIYKTTNGGATWTTDATPSSWLLAMCFVDANTGWAVGLNGTILHYGDATAHPVDAVDEVSQSAHRTQVLASSNRSPVTGASITADRPVGGGAQGVTDILGRLDIATAGPTTVTAKKSGYRVNKMILNLEPKKTSTLFLDPWVSDGKPYLSMAAFKESTTNYMDGIRQNIYIAEGDGARRELICDADWNGNGAGEYTLYQENARISNTTGRFSFVPGKTFQPGKAVYLRLKAANGVISQTKLRIAVTSRATADWPGGVKLGEETGFEVGDNVPVFGGLKAELGFDMIPISVVREGNTFKAGFGVTDVVKMKDNWKDFTGSIDKARSEVKMADLVRQYSADGKVSSPSYSLTEKWKTEPEVAGYAEGVIDPDGTFRVTKGYLLASIDTKKSWGRQYVLGYVPVYVEAMAGCELDLETGIQKIIAADGTLVCYSDLTVTPKGSLGAGVGVKGAASVGAEGSAKLPIYISGQQDYMTVEATGEMKIKVSLLYVFTAEHVIAKKTWPLWDSRESAQTASALAPIRSRNLFDESAFRLSPRVGGAPPARGLATAQAVDLTDPFVPIVPNAMPSAQPQMVTVGDRLLAVFQTDDLDRSDLNRTTLCYSVREDGVWSEPTPVWDNGAPDGSAALASDGQSAWLVWQKADRALSVPAAATESEMIDALSSAQEIAVARWDDAADGFVGSTYITDNETLDLLPAATVEGGSAHVAWVNNSSSDVFGRSGLNTVRSAVPSAGRWSVVDVGATTAPVLELAAGTVAGAPVFAYTIDKDGDLNTATDIELVLANMSARYTLSDNAVAETGPRFHDGRLYWYDGTLRSCDPATRIASPVFGEDAPLGAAYSLVSDGSRDGVVWLSSEPETGTAVCARWFEGPDSDQSFEITRTQKRIDVIVPDYSPTEGWGLLANLGVEDSSSIAYASVSPRPDMVLEGVSVDPDSRTAQGLTVELSLRNAGQTAASDLVLQVEEQGSGTKLAPIALTSSLEAGASGVETVRVPLPVLHDETDYAFEVVCAEDAYAADNTVVETLGKVDLALDVKHYVLGDQAVIVSHVLNNSSTETSAVLEIREDGESGAVVATQDIPSVGNSMGQVFTAVVPLFTESSESSPAPLAYVVEVRSAADEIVSGNNVALLTAEQLGGVPYDGEVTVTAPVQVEGISITNTPEGSVFDAQDIGSTHALSYETVPALASNQTVTWESSDSSVATVDANGVVTIQGSGTSTVTVTSADGSSTDTFEIKVFSAAVHIIEFMSAREVVGHADFADGEFLGSGSLPILERIGYTHAGWSREEGGAAIDSASYRVLASGPLYAVWAADSSAIVDSPGVMCPATVFDGTARASWGPVAGATSYEWRLNFASDWAPVLDRAVTVGGLASGPNIIEVRGVSDAGVGPAGFATVNALAVERVAGNDRYGTAAALARKGWDPTGSLAWSGVEHIIIANGEPGKESDPLSAAGLAGIYDAPVLTVQAKKLPSATKTVITEIAKKNPGVRIHIVGGESVVPVARWNDIKRIPGVSQVKDQFAGRDRFETSALMATRMVAVAGADAIKGVILIAGDNPAAFYDALAASPIACAQTMPMLSVQKTKIPTSVKNVLKTAALKDKPRYAASSATYIGSVPAAGALRMTTTSNRYTAATQITKFAAIDRDWTSRADTALASKLPDALTGGAFLGRVGGIMLFTDSAGSIQSTSEAFITGNKDGIVNGWVIGGTSVVPKAQETSFRNLLN